MILPLPIFAYCLFGAMIKTNFDDSPQSFETAKTQLELDKVFFGNVSAEGVTWNLAKKSFLHDFDEMGDRLTIFGIQNMKARNASSDANTSFIRKHLRPVLKLCIQAGSYQHAGKLILLICCAKPSE